ncbi:MAG: amidohydrolase family protein [Mucilaginibacter sp.]
MILRNVNILGDKEATNILVSNGYVTAVTRDDVTEGAGELIIYLENALAVPGLINSHDHLDFNLFPPLGGDRCYTSYTEWGRHLHASFKKEIASVLKIPSRLRYQWGVYKNLLCGVTTVINHGEKTGLKTDLITIYEDSHCLHSVRFEKNWKLKLNNPARRKKIVNIHIGEGTDADSSAEIDTFIRFNLLKRKLVGVHAVAMTGEQARAFEALVWCPASNLFLLNKTAQVDLLQSQTALLFGTDSTLTGDWDIWRHLQSARNTALLDDETLFTAVNLTAASVWGLNTGSITAGKDADLLIVKNKTGGYGFDEFFSICPEDILLVIHKGRINLFDESLLPQLESKRLDNFSRVFFGDCCKYIKGDLRELLDNIRQYKPDVKLPITVNEAVEV